MPSGLRTGPDSTLRYEQPEANGNNRLPDEDAAMNIDDYQMSEFTHGEWTRPVYQRGDGPAVIIMHEMPGLHPLVLRFAERVIAAGMSVYLPSLFGVPGKEVSPGYLAAEMLKGVCIRREFSTWASDRSSPIVEWLRALARHAHQTCGGRGVGAVGMCFTGGFALAMMTEPAVVAPVLSQPSLPLAIGPGARKRAGAIDASPEEIAVVRQRLEDEDLKLLGLRFKSDKLVPDARFSCLKATFGERFEPIELNDEDALADTGMAPHSVLTIHLDDTDPEGPTRQAENRTIAHFATYLGLFDELG